MAPLANPEPIRHRRVSACRVGRERVAIRPEDHIVGDVADRARHPFRLKLRVECVVGGENRVELPGVPESEHEVGLLVLQRCMAVEAHLL